MRFTFETIPVAISDKLREALGGRAWVRRKNRKALHRLREILEQGEDRAGHAGGVSRRVTVAGG